MNKSKYGLTHLEKLEQEIKQGTYNIWKTFYSQDGQGSRMLTVELDCSDGSIIDFLSFNHLIEDYQCLLVSVGQVRSYPGIVQFNIEEEILS